MIRSQATVVRDDWLVDVVNRCQVFALRTGDVRNAGLGDLVADSIGKLPGPYTPVEAVLLRGMLLELALHWAARIHSRPLAHPHKTLAAAAELLERHWGDRSRPPVEAFVEWARDFVGALDGDTELSPVDEAMRIIDERYAQRLNIGELAREVACHPARLRKLFRDRVGMSMRAYHTQARVRRALQLLRDPGNKVDAAAQEAGFRSRRCFYGAIRRATGRAPSAQRRLRLSSAAGIQAAE